MELWRLTRTKNFLYVGPLQINSRGMTRFLFSLSVAEPMSSFDVVRVADSRVRSESEFCRLSSATVLPS